VFVTIEDETGIANLIVWPEILGRSRYAASASPYALHRIGRELTKPHSGSPPSRHRRWTTHYRWRI
jgi:hypothetical protein